LTHVVSYFLKLNEVRFQALGAGEPALSPVYGTIYFDEQPRRVRRMSTGATRIFVSCGQGTPDEKALGLAIKGTIDSTPGFEGFFAESVQSFQSLSEHLLAALADCSGAVVALHPRGTIVCSGVESGTRSSVWVNQEIAILAFRQHCEGTELPVLLFKDPSVDLEGIMKYLILNPLVLDAHPSVVQSVKDWLVETTFTVGVLQKTIDQSWAGLPEGSRMLLAAILDGGGSNVGQMLLQNILQADTYQLPPEQIGKAIIDAVERLASTGFVEKSNSFNGYQLSIPPGLSKQLARKIRVWKESRQKGGGSA
jgi:hypothetical protein